MTRSAWAAGLACAIFTGCGSAPSTVSIPAPHNAAEVRSALMEAILQKDHCYLANSDYCIRDADFLDQALARVLGSSTLEELAANQKDFRKAYGDAAGAYTALASTEDGLGRLSRVIEARFAKPVVTMVGDVVRADYGHVGAKLVVGAGGKIGIAFNESPHLNEHQQWKTTEAAGAMQSMMDAHPDANAVEVRVLIPGSLMSDEWIYKYRKYVFDRQRIPIPNPAIHVVLTSPPGRDYTTERLKSGLEPYVRGEKSLDTGVLGSSR